MVKMNDNDTPLLAAGGERGKMRACDADRDRVVEFLSVAYSEGRLSKDEYDGRLENALSARTYADLDQIVTDLPAAQAAVVPPVARTNGLAIASLACGLAQFVFGPLATIPAIVFGHVARHQIKRTGEQGAGLALAGLILGWAAVILAILLLIVGRGHVRRDARHHALSGEQVSRGRHRRGGRSCRRATGLAAHDQDRAVRVMDAVLADGAEQRVREAPVAAAA